MGMNYGATFTDTGCTDKNYLTNVKAAADSGIEYSAEAILDSCWADELVTRWGLHTVVGSEPPQRQQLPDWAA